MRSPCRARCLSEFMWSSQHLDHAVRGWRGQEGGRQQRREGLRRRRAGRRWPRREHRQRFWQAVAAGLSREDAGVVAGCRQHWEHGGSVRLAACGQSLTNPHDGLQQDRGGNSHRRFARTRRPRNRHRRGERRAITRRIWNPMGAESRLGPRCPRLERRRWRLERRIRRLRRRLGPPPPPSPAYGYGG
jgi:hypothetical protein